VPLHASRWSARAQKSLFLPLCVSVLFSRFAANFFFAYLSSPLFFPPPSSFGRLVVRCAFYSFSMFQEVSLVLLFCFVMLFFLLSFFSSRFSRVEFDVLTSHSHSQNFTFVPWAPNRWFCDVSRRDRFRVSRACHSSTSRDYNAPPRPRRAGMIIRNRFARLRDSCIHNVYVARSGYSRSPIRELLTKVSISVLAELLRQVYSNVTDTSTNPIRVKNSLSLAFAKCFNFKKKIAKNTAKFVNNYMCLSSKCCQILWRVHSARYRQLRRNSNSVCRNDSFIIRSLNQYNVSTCRQHPPEKPTAKSNALPWRAFINFVSASLLRVQRASVNLAKMNDIHGGLVQVSSRYAESHLATRLLARANLEDAPRVALRRAMRAVTAAHVAR